MSNEPVLRLLGLAKRAGRLQAGEEPAGGACRARQARLMLLARDAAPNTRRRADHFRQAGNVPCLELPFDKAALGLALGRSSCAMLAVTDAGLAAAVAEQLAARDPERYGPAAAQLAEGARRVLQRQREQRRHEKNRKKPWAPPPPPSNKRAPTARGKPKTAEGGKPDRDRKGPNSRPPVKSGPGGRRLTGRSRHS